MLPRSLGFIALAWYRHLTLTPAAEMEQQPERHRRRNFIRAVLILAFTCCCTQVEAAVTKGTVSSTDGFAFIGKFCFQYLPSGAPVGTVSLDLSMPLYNEVQQDGARGGQTDQTDLALVLFDDQEESWPTVMDMGEDWDCNEKMRHAKGHYTYRPSEWVHSADGRTVTLSASLTSITQRLRPRFWFFALARCRGGMDHVSYHLHMTQSMQSGWTKEFGSNEEGLNSLYLCLFLLTAALVAAHIHSTLQLHAQIQFLHPLLRLFLAVLGLELLSTFAMLVHYLSFARDGLGSPALLHWGTILDIFSRSLFMILLLLLAKGWCISPERLLSHREWILGVVGASTLLSILSAVWEWNEDARRSDPTFGRASVDLLETLVWIAFATGFLYWSYEGWKSEGGVSADDEKRRLYLWLALLFGPWFILPPLAPVLSFAISPWARENVVITWMSASNLLAYSVAVGLFWHSRAGKYFAIATPDVSQRGGEYEKL